MPQAITVQGLVATTPRHIKTQEGVDITSFRLASSDRKYDRSKQRWVDGNINWYTITLHNQIAINTAKSINKGDRILVLGNLNIIDWDNGSSSGTSIEVEATAIGHDLSWGESVFNRTVLVKTPEADEIDNTAELERVKQELAELKETLAELAED